VNSPVRTDQVKESVKLLVETGSDAAYHVLKGRRMSIGEVLGDHECTEFVLRAWLQAGPEDWNLWHVSIPTETQESEEVAELAGRVLVHLFDSWPAVGSAEAENFSELVASLVELSRPFQKDGAEHAVTGALERALDPPEWATDGPTREHREHLHKGARELKALGGMTWQKVEALLANDLRSGIERAHSATPGVPANSMFEAVRGVETMGQKLGDGALTHVLTIIPEFDATTEPDEASAEVSARSVLTKIAKDRKLDVKKTPFGVSAKQVRSVAETKGQVLDDAISNWLELRPPARDVIPVAGELVPSLSNSMGAALDEWSKSVSRPQRTSLAKSLLDFGPDATLWLEVISKQGLDETGLVEIVRGQVLNGGSVAMRKQSAREAKALSLTTAGAGNSLSGAVTTLLTNSRASGDIGVAALLVAALPNGFARAKTDQWRKAFKQRCDKTGYRLKPEEAEALQSSGIEPPSEGLTKKLAKALGLRK
jgi:hypothetical protein